jgi:hypothetical protein
MIPSRMELNGRMLLVQVVLITFFPAVGILCQETFDSIEHRASSPAVMLAQIQIQIQGPDHEAGSGPEHYTVSTKLIVLTA